MVTCKCILNICWYLAIGFGWWFVGKVLEIIYWVVLGGIFYVKRLRMKAELYKDK